MSLPRATTASDHKLRTSFETLRKELLDQEKYAPCLEKPLAYWARPNDRRLPMVFLGRKVGDLLHTPYTEIASTPGVGHKKIQSLMKLLRRATKDAPVEEVVREPDDDSAVLKGNFHDFDSALVSESVWVLWRDTVRRNDLKHEKLGRLAPSLQRLPSVIWHTQLRRYLDLSLQDIRDLKTHGEKRVSAVLEVFHSIHRLLNRAGSSTALSIRLVPQFIPPLERRLVTLSERAEFCTVEEIRRQVAQTLLSQIKLDAGPTVHELALSRLGLDEIPQTVRQLARRVNVTRARVYQLLEECSKVMDVRWPEGRAQLSSLAARATASGAADDTQVLLGALCDLCFPTKAG